MSAKTDLQARALALLEPLYQAEFSADGWPLFLRRLMTEMESDVAIAVLLDRQCRPLEFMSEGIFSKGMMGAYEAHFATIDPWVDAFVVAGNPLGKNVCSHEVMHPREFERTEYYNDFWRPNQDLFHTCGALIEVDGNTLANIGLPRVRGRGAYDRSHIALLDLMSPHIQSALRLHQRLNQANRAAADASAALDRMEDALFIADGAGRLLYANPAANAELATGSRVACRRNRLAAGHRVAQHEFDRAFRAATDVANRTATLAPASVVSTELNPELRASVTFYPLPSPNASWPLDGANVLVIVCQARARQTVSLALLRMLYDLTPAEARIAKELAGGSSLEETAMALRIGVATARVHLKHIFLKTATKRQGQLVSLLNRARPQATAS